MDHVYPAVEGCGLSEEYEFRSAHKLLGHPFHTLEKHCFQLACTIANPDAKSFLVNYFRTQDDRLYLNEGHIRTDVADAYERAPVDISERVQTQQLADRFHGQFLFHQGSSFRADSGEKLYVCIKSVLCHNLANLLKNSDTSHKGTIIR